MKGNKDDIGRKDVFLGGSIFKRFWKVAYLKLPAIHELFRKCFSTSNLRTVVPEYVRTSGRRQNDTCEKEVYSLTASTVIWTPVHFSPPLVDSWWAIMYQLILATELENLNSKGMLYWPMWLTVSPS